MIARCAICNRPLTNPASLQHGIGPDCLKRAVLAGTAPTGAMVEQTRQRAKGKRTARQLKRIDTQTPDLFEFMNEPALNQG